MPKQLALIRPGEVVLAAFREPLDIS